MEVWVTNLQNKVAVSSEFIRRVVTHVLAASGCDDAVEVSVALVDDAYIRELNREYRDVDAPTDVLAFPMEGEDHGPVRMLGDIVVSLERARDQARQFKQPLKREIALLTIHGVLHLLGHEDETEAGASTMWQRQKAILAKFEEGRSPAAPQRVGRAKKKAYG
ncbi:MAG: rRNA maturation RNase YbeY [Armatimonadetes bacterium]|nr:rRNA maturation RNase YbeY [Armatimonadota bacterium]